MLVDTLEDIWNTILDTTALFVIPDWGAVIGLLPILIFLDYDDDDAAIVGYVERVLFNGSQHCVSRGPAAGGV